MSAVVLPDIRNVSRQDHRVHLELYILPELHYFKGHFPANPVLPGVVQTHWAIQLGSEFLKTTTTIRKLEVIKFQKLILPEMGLQLTLELKDNGKLQFSYVCGEEKMSSGRIVFRGTNEH